MSKKHIFISEILISMSFIFFIGLLLNDKVFKYMILGIPVFSKAVALLFLTGLLLVIPLLIVFGVFIIVKYAFYKNGLGKFVVIFNYVVTLLILVVCVYGISLQSNYEKTISYYGSKEELVETLEKRLRERNPDYHLEFVDVKVSEGNPIWLGVEGDESFAKTNFTVKVTTKNEIGMKKMKQYDYMYEGRQLQIMINCYSDGKCAIAEKQNGPVVY
ncbi:hypothetical protein [Lysinibacillus sp. 54212]|uniref:hypothetical protein n=1 Tax=Lysinibacillus sp. 54212 TaxID=3119829 RepID=UPI002FC62536